MDPVVFQVVKVDNIPPVELEDLVVSQLVKAGKVDSFHLVVPVDLEVSPGKEDVLEVLELVGLVEQVEMKMMGHMTKAIIQQFLVNQGSTIPYIQKFPKRRSNVTNSSIQDTMQMLRRDVRYSIFVPITRHTTFCVQMEQFFIKSTSYVYGGISLIVTPLLASILSIRNFTTIRL